jgi:hypothetical protein
LSSIVDVHMKPGAVVILKGVIVGMTLSAVVYKIHPPGTVMTDPVGEERVWMGKLPIIDAVAVVPKAQSVDLDAPPDPNEGDITILQKIAYGPDIEAVSNLKNLPNAILQISPRYYVVGEMFGV